MIEELYKMTRSDQKTIERIIQDENIHYNHIILATGDRLPEHYTNATVYMTVLRGTLSIGLNDQEVKQYEPDSILKIQKGVKMNVVNEGQGVLEITVIKSPAPQSV